MFALRLPMRPMITKCHQACQSGIYIIISEKIYLISSFDVRRAEGRLRFTCLSMSSSKTSSMSVISVVTSMNSRLAFRSSPVNGSSSLCKVKVKVKLKLKFSHLFYCQYQAHSHVLINGGLHLNSQPGTQPFLVRRHLLVVRSGDTNFTPWSG